MIHVPFSVNLDQSTMSILEIWSQHPHWTPISNTIKKKLLAVEQAMSVWKVFNGSIQFNRSILHWTTLKMLLETIVGDLLGVIW